jgi:hypothetical protein
VGGVSRDAGLADVMVSADVILKKTGMGLFDPQLPTLPSWIDLLRVSQGAWHAGPQGRHRWWFSTPTNPLPRSILFDSSICLLTRNEIVVYTEHENVIWGTGKGGREAEVFAAAFTENLPALAKKQRPIASLFQVFRLIDLFVHIKATLPPGMDLPGKDYWQKGYSSRWPAVPNTVPTLARRLQFGNMELTVSGGVRIPIDPPGEIERASLAD